MNTTIQILTASGRLEPFVNEILRGAKKAVSIIKSKIPLPRVDIVFYDNPEGVIPHLGIGGFAPNANLVFISLDPSYQNFNKTISDEISRTLAHELHHAIRWQNPGYGKTLLEAMITEGLADHFDIELTNTKPQLWDTALTEKQLINFSKRAQQEYHNRNYNHQEWFFGSKEKGIPKWTGYALGFKLVKDYLKRNPDKKASELYSIKAEEIIEN